MPIAIHFWHQKRGKPLPWAATQWLTEARQQQSRGLRLDTIWLLLLRCLLLLLLAVMLAQPLLNWFTSPQPVQNVHLVQPNERVANNFRFELTEARKKGERVMWANTELTDIDELDNKPIDVQKSIGFDALSLQAAVNQLDLPNTNLHLYAVNSQTLASVPTITVPARFQLHTIMDSTRQPQSYLSGKDGRKLFVNRAGKLTSSATLDERLKFRPDPVHSGLIKTVVNYRNEPERQTVKAALVALAEVYGLDISIDEKPKPVQEYDWVLTDQVPQKTTPKTLYIVSGTTQQPTFPNIISTPQLLTPQTDERVAAGQLPEWLGSRLIRHYKLISDTKPLTRPDLNALFVRTKKRPKVQQVGVQNALLLLFVGLLILERWLAFTKNA